MGHSKLSTRVPGLGNPAVVPALWQTGGPVVQLDNGDTGYCAHPRRWDDCFRAAIATATQIPIELVPDPQLHRRLRAGQTADEINEESWQAISRWLHRRGLQLVLHDTVPVDRERWIGVCRWPDHPTNPFADHCLVMSYDRIIFDPARSAVAPPGKRLRTWRGDEVTYGLSFDPRKKE